MNCRNFDERLDEHLDGELPAAQVRELEAHAADCAACSASLAAARRLQREAFILPGELEPPRDLWPGIAARLEPRGGTWGERRWLRALAASVAVVGVFAVGMLTSRMMLEGDASLPLQQVEREPATRDKALPDAAEARRILPASYVELVDDAVPGDGMNGSDQALLRNLLVVNLAIREVEAAIARDPANADLRELLSGLYAEENRILAQAERLRTARRAPTRTAI